MTEQSPRSTSDSPNGASTLIAVRRLRNRASELRQIAHQLNQEADFLERKLVGPMLSGAHVAERVVELLTEADTGDPGWRGLHYKDLAERIEADGTRIRGVDPAATLLANVHRDSRIVCAEQGTGRYRLAR